MAGRVSLGLVAVASPLLVLASLIALPGGDVLFALAAVAAPVALLGVGRGGASTSRLILPLLLLLGGSVVAMLVLRGTVTAGPWIGGLPAGFAVLVYGVFLLPLLLVPAAYARGFDRHGLRRRDLDALRRRFPRR